MKRFSFPAGGEEDFFLILSSLSIYIIEEFYSFFKFQVVKSAEADRFFQTFGWLGTREPFLSSSLYFLYIL